MHLKKYIKNNKNNYFLNYIKLFFFQLFYFKFLYLFIYLFISIFYSCCCSPTGHSNQKKNYLPHFLSISVLRGALQSDLHFSMHGGLWEAMPKNVRSLSAILLICHQPYQIVQCECEWKHGIHSFSIGNCMAASSMCVFASG